MKHIEGRGYINTLDELREEVYAIRSELPQEIGKILHQLLDANLESRTDFELCTFNMTWKMVILYFEDREKGVRFSYPFYVRDVLLCL